MTPVAGFTFEKQYGLFKVLTSAGHWWLTPVILAIQEAEIRRITVLSQPRQIVHETLSQKKTRNNKGLRSGSGCRP
jgi:hypothetical protein